MNSLRTGTVNDVADIRQIIGMTCLHGRLIEAERSESRTYDIKGRSGWTTSSGTGLDDPIHCNSRVSHHGASYRHHM